MTRSTKASICTSLSLALALTSSANAFTIHSSTARVTNARTSNTASETQLKMGLFDGVRDAFSAPALERTTLDAERETPIDRWMGWSVSKDNQQQAPNGRFFHSLLFLYCYPCLPVCRALRLPVHSFIVFIPIIRFVVFVLSSSTTARYWRLQVIEYSKQRTFQYASTCHLLSIIIKNNAKYSPLKHSLIHSNPSTALPTDYVDSMDPTNYVTIELVKPMGIVFEENDEEYGGIFVQSLKEDSAAAAVLQSGDQLVGVNTFKVSSLVFDDALSAIVESTGETTKLILFRGTAKQFYGPTGASQAWLDEFISGGAAPPVAAANEE